MKACVDVRPDTETSKSNNAQDESERLQSGSNQTTNPMIVIRTNATKAQQRPTRNYKVRAANARTAFSPIQVRWLASYFSSTDLPDQRARTPILVRDLTRGSLHDFLYGTMTSDKLFYCTV
jgi:hypothetical protein